MDTGKAIGAVTRLIRDHLKAKVKHVSGLPSFEVTVGRPEPPKTDSSTGPRLNLFLYETHFDQFLKNTVIHDGMPPPLWLVLKYLLTAFDTGGDSDSPEAHDIIGQGIQALQSLTFLPLTASTAAHLKDNPETLKITFDESSSDLLHKLTLGSDLKYRFSICFEVRPVMIASEELSTSYSLLVGIDYTKSPPEEIGEKGIQIPVLPSFGSSISTISPSKFEINSTISILGENLNLSGLIVLFDSLELPVVSSGFNRVECKIDGMIITGTAVSAGAHSISIVQALPSGKARSSNILAGELLPSLTGITIISLEKVNPANPASDVFGKIEMTGSFLGKAQDDIFVALYKEGKTIKVFSEPSVTPSSPSGSPQTRVILDIEKEDPVPPATYRLILRVNEQQAKNSPSVELVVP